MDTPRQIASERRKRFVLPDSRDARLEPHLHVSQRHDKRTDPPFKWSLTRRDLHAVVGQDHTQKAGSRGLAECTTVIPKREYMLAAYTNSYEKERQIVKGPTFEEVLLVNLGEIKDFVLVSELIAALKRARPATPLTLLCRSEFRPIVDMYPVQPDEVVGVPFHLEVFGYPTDQLQNALLELLKQLARHRFEALIDAGRSSHWLSGFLAAALDPDVILRCCHGCEDAKILPAILERFGLSAKHFRDLESRCDVHERERYRILGEALDSPPTPVFPWSLPKESERAAQGWLGGHGLELHKYLLCAPFGGTRAPIKRWPMERYSELLHQSYRELAMPVLLMGYVNEHESLMTLNSLLFDIPTSYFTGRMDDLKLIAGLLALAGAYVSHDTDLSYLAQAFEVPGVTIFGGGEEWQPYAPWARSSVGLCHPLPCFGCGWDCFLGHGLCVELVPVEKVQEALRQACDTEQPPRHIILETIGEPLTSLVADASARYREVQRDRSETLAVIEELDRSRHQWAATEQTLRRRVAEAEAGTAVMKRIADERLAVLERIHMEAAHRLDVLQEVNAEAEARRQTIERLSRELAGSESIVPAAHGTTGASHWIATGANAEYFPNARLLVASWWEHCREIPLLFCDFGLTAEQHKEAGTWPVRLADTPAHLANVQPQRAKAGLIHFLNEAVVDWRSVVWIDADAMFLRPLPPLDELTKGYDFVCDASPLPVAEGIDPGSLELLPFDPADACFDAGFWTTTNPRLLEALDRFAEVLRACGRFQQLTALTAAVYGTGGRVRPLNGSLWHIRGTMLDTVAVDGDRVGSGGQRAYVLHANRRFAVQADGRKLLCRDVLRAIQLRFAERYVSAVKEWTEALQTAVG